MIQNDDLNGLLGRGKKGQDKWLSNFIIDEYLRLIQVTCAANNSLAVETLPWELFERAVGSLPLVEREKSTSASGCSPCAIQYPRV